MDKTTTPIIGYQSPALHGVCQMVASDAREELNLYNVFVLDLLDMMYGIYDKTYQMANLESG